MKGGPGGRKTEKDIIYVIYVIMIILNEVLLQYIKYILG